MKAKTFRLFINLVMGAVLPLLTLTAEKARAQQPHYNVLFIAVDDMNDRISFLGNPEIKAPNLQRLVSRGIVFKNVYCQYPICNPSRSSLMSGWRPDKTQVFSNSTQPRLVMGDTVKYIPEYFKAYGYTTRRYGKIMHGLFESDCKWDYAEPGNGGGDFSTTEIEKLTKKSKSSSSRGDWWIQNVADTSAGGDSVVTEHMFLQLQQTNKPEPWFYGFGLHTHNPFNTNVKYWNINGDSSVSQILPANKSNTTFTSGNGSSNIFIPQTPVNDLDDIPSIAITTLTTKDSSEWKNTIHAYDGEVSQFDSRLGRILDQLDSQNLWSNIIVVFWSDHGQHLGEHNGLWLKNTLFHESLHVPFIICVPGKNPGVCDKLIEYVDIYPTLAELCGLPPPPGMEGSSFAKLLDNNNLPWKDAVFSQVQRPTSNNTMGRSVMSSIEGHFYHYNSWLTYGEELYDRTTDPNEWTNLVGNSSYGTVLDSMRKILADGWTKHLPPTYTMKSFYPDTDGDGYGDRNDSIFGYIPTSGYVLNNTDCNDADSTIHPGAIEICDGIDNNCNGLIDEGSTFYPDTDGDGYGDRNESSNKIVACTQPSGYVANNIDCNDADSTIHPGAIEICDGIDNNCNGLIDEGLLSVFYRDFDKDGYGDRNDSIFACSVPTGYVINKNDCNDANATVYPGATEICSDGIDNNCDAVIDEKPTATITALGSLDICGTNAVVLQSNIVTNATYKWRKNNVGISGATSNTYTATSIGDYKVVITTSGGCVRNSNILTVTKTCLQSIVAKNSDEVVSGVSSLIISPIPSTGRVTVSYNASKGGVFALEVSDVLGKKVFIQKESFLKGKNIFSLDLSLAPGTYYLVINDDRKKLIIQK